MKITPQGLAIFLCSTMFACASLADEDMEILDTEEMETSRFPETTAGVEQTANEAGSSPLGDLVGIEENTDVDGGEGSGDISGTDGMVNVDGMPEAEAGNEEAGDDGSMSGNNMEMPGNDDMEIFGAIDVCGDNLIGGTEACDDGNIIGGDGCSADCQQVEPGYTCPTELGGGGVCTEINPNGLIDTLEWVQPCTTLGCSVAHTGVEGGSHNLHFFLSEQNIAYHVKGNDQRCWEKLQWDSEFISIPFDNCWGGNEPYRYTSYADGRWLKRWWAPGESFNANHTVYAGSWEECLNVEMSENPVRTMTFLWRDQNYDWGGAAGVRDTIAVQQSYTMVPNIREIYYYARGWGLIKWEYVHDGQPQSNMFANFNQNSSEYPLPCVSPCTPATLGVGACPCTPSCNQTSICGISDDGCGGTCQLGSGCQNGIATNRSLPRGNCVSSIGGNARVCHQNDGNVVIYSRTNAVVWNTMTGSQATTSLTMQEDGNLVLYNVTTPIWHSVTGGRPRDNFVAVIQDDCNFVVYNPSGTAVWNSGRPCP